MKSAARIVDYLEARGIDCTLIGGVALGAHGIARATLDVDILVADPAVLDPRFWGQLGDLQAPEIRRGDIDDPLLGLVRFGQLDEPVDVVVGRSPLAAGILQRRHRLAIDGRSLPMVDRADLILLKLFAGGPQDLLDISLLLAADETGSLRRQVEERLAEAPQAAHAAWRKLR